MRCRANGRVVIQTTFHNLLAIDLAPRHHSPSSVRLPASRAVSSTCTIGFKDPQVIKRKALLGKSLRLRGDVAVASREHFGPASAAWRGRSAQAASLSSISTMIGRETYRERPRRLRNVGAILVLANAKVCKQESTVPNERESESSSRNSMCRQLVECKMIDAHFGDKSARPPLCIASRATNSRSRRESRERSTAQWLTDKKSAARQ